MKIEKFLIKYKEEEEDYVLKTFMFALKRAEDSGDSTSDDLESAFKFFKAGYACAEFFNSVIYVESRKM